MKNRLLKFIVYGGMFFISQSSFGATTLTSGQAISSSVSKGNWKYYIINSSGYTDVNVSMTGLSSDVDLYVRKGAQPSLESYDCRPWTGGKSSENCNLSLTTSNDIYVAIHGYTKGNFSIKATLSGANTSGLSIPSGFSEMISKTGVKVYKKNYSGGQPDYVQVVDLSTGAKIKLMTGDITSSGTGHGLYNGDNAMMKRQTLKSAWDDFIFNENDAVCITNGQFFANVKKGKPTNLSFPTKIDGFLMDGNAPQYTGKKLIFKIHNGHAEINNFSEDIRVLSNNSLVGLTEDADKGINTRKARTFIGVLDNDNNGKNEIVLIFNSQFSTQPEAATILKDFGASKVVMFDGGGSTQLICNSNSLISSSRGIPQTIGVISGSSENSEAEQWIDKCINKFPSYFGNKMGSSYSCNSNYLCQNTSGPLIGQIKIHQTLIGSKFKYYWNSNNGWYEKNLSICEYYI